MIEHIILVPSSNMEEDRKKRRVEPPRNGLLPHKSTCDVLREQTRQDHHNRHRQLQRHNNADAHNQNNYRQSHEDGNRPDVFKSKARKDSSETRRVVDTLNYAVSSSERQHALELAYKALSHTNIALHDHEIQMGVDKALCLKLGYIVSTDCNQSQISLVCRCLRNVYQCSTTWRMKAFRNLGATDILPLLIHVWNREIPHLTEDLVDNDHECKLLIDILRILRVYAKLDETAKNRLICLDPWMLNTLQFILTYFMSVSSEENVNKGDSNHLQGLISASTPTTKPTPTYILELLGFIKDLTFRSRCEDKEYLLNLGGGILKEMLFFAFENLSLDGKVAETLTAVIWNLALSDSTATSLLSLHKKPSLSIVEGLYRVLSIMPTDRDHVDQAGLKDQRTATGITPKTRRNAISALGNMLANEHNSGNIFQMEMDANLSIIGLLKELGQSDADSNIRRRSVRTLRCLASQIADDKEGSTQCWEMFCTHNMIAFFVESIKTEPSEDDDNDRDVQIQICQAIGSLVGKMDVSMWPLLEISLRKRIETTTDPKLTVAACSCLLLCVANDPLRRDPSTFSEDFWKRLKSSVESSSETHNTIAQLYFELAQQEQKNRAPRSTQQKSDLVNDTVIDTLTILLSEFNGNCDDSRNFVVDTVELFIQNTENKRSLAEHEGLLSALVNLCIVQPDSSKKGAAKQAILSLVPEI